MIKIDDTFVNIGEGTDTVDNGLTILNDLQSNYETKISRINRWLEETYGFKVYDQVELQKLYQVKTELDLQREQLKSSLPFNSYHAHPEYAKNILLSEKNIFSKFITLSLKSSTVSLNFSTFNKIFSCNASSNILV